MRVVGDQDIAQARVACGGHTCEDRSDGGYRREHIPATRDAPAAHTESYGQGRTSSWNSKE